MTCDSPYQHLLEPMVIRGKLFRNRMLFSAHSHPQCRENFLINDEGIAYYAARARGGAAQVTFGETPVDRIHAFKGSLEEQLLINEPLTFGRMTKMSKFPTVIHSYGALASIQLNHAGQAAFDPIGPMEFIRKDGKRVRAMTEQDIQDVVEAFSNSARMAKISGFDGVQIHGGHGWLLAQFTSPLTNQRTDQYGGSLENRLRFPIRVLTAVREAIGSDMLIEYRISGDELTEGGYHQQEAREICQLLEPYVDLFQVSAGIYTAGPGNRMFPSIYDAHCCNVGLAANIKQAVNVPVIAVGSIMTPEEAEHIIASGQADFVAMARQMLAEPRFAKKVQQNKTQDIIPCIRCFGCMAGEFGPPFALKCSVNPYAGNEQWLTEELPKAHSQRVAVVGGGPAGMEAALTAKQAGHQVVLYEKSDRLGGALWFTDIDRFKTDLRRYRDYLIGQVSCNHIEVHLNTEADEGCFQAHPADVIICALGASPVVPELPGVQYANHAIEAYRHSYEKGDRVVILGGGLTSCETGLHLAARGCRVIIVARHDRLARGGFVVHVQSMLRELEKAHVTIVPNATCQEILPNGVTITQSDGAPEFLAAEHVLYAIGMTPNDSAVRRLEACAPLVIPVGDCRKPGKVGDAVREAYFAIRNLQ